MISYGQSSTPYGQPARPDEQFTVIQQSNSSQQSNNPVLHSTLTSTFQSVTISDSSQPPVSYDPNLLPIMNSSGNPNGYATVYSSRQSEPPYPTEDSFQAVNYSRQSEPITSHHSNRHSLQSSGTSNRSSILPSVPTNNTPSNTNLNNRIIDRTSTSIHSSSERENPTLE